MSELKPCPFCGGNNCGVRAGTDEIWCVCGGHSPHGWNSRPIEDALRAENEKLKEALQKIKNWCCVDPDGGVETTISEMVEQALKGGI